MIPGATCANCVYFDPNPRPDPGRIGGQCRRKAPSLDRGHDGKLRMWPLVWGDYWCGEHAVLDDEPEAEVQAA